MSDLVSCNLESQVATIHLHNGKVNAFSPEMVTAINEALDQAEADKAVVMFVGKPGIFSAGFDLTIMKSDDTAAKASLVSSGTGLCRRILAFPTPVMAVCTGHALAMGTLFLLSCDYLIGAEGDFKLGMNEVQIGMTMPQCGVELARGRLLPPFYHRAVTNAELFNPQQAVVAGLLDRVVDVNELMETANAEAQRLAGLDMEAFHQTKLRVRGDWLARMDAAYQQDEIDLAAGLIA